MFDTARRNQFPALTCIGIGHHHTTRRGREMSVKIIEREDFDRYRRARIGRQRRTCD